MAVKKTPIIKSHDILIAYGDRHAPHQDKHLEDILLEIIRDVKPDIIVEGGDMISADCLSNYPKKSYQMAGLQAELDEDYRWRKRVNAAASKHTRKIILKDNHFFRRLEDRKRETLWLEDLRSLNAEAILRCEELGWDLVSEYEWKDRILFLHGDEGGPGSQKCPVNKVREMKREFGCSVVRFHSHVTGFEAWRDRKDQVMYGIQLGTFEAIDKTTYIRHKRMVPWTASAGIFYLSKTSDEFMFEPITFSGGKATFNGVLYS